MTKCERCGVETTEVWPTGVTKMVDDSGEEHDLARCLARVVEQRDEARRERDVAWDDCRDGSCHACAKCFDSLEAQLHAAREAMRAHVNEWGDLAETAIIRSALAALDATEGK